MAPDHSVPEGHRHVPEGHPPVHRPGYGGDATIQARLEIFQSRREAVREQMRQLRETLDLLDFKCWYYETARAAGTTAVPREMPPEEIPEQYRKARRQLKSIPKD